MASLASASPLATIVPPKPRFAFTRNAMVALVGFWLLYCVIAMIWFRQSIALFEFIDVDDAMRLQQVRDWIGGQGWFDVSQHRVNPPLGGPMHWSRIVDLPIAAIILLMRPFVGMATAEIIACVAVPLMLLGCLCAVLHRAVRLLADSAVPPLFTVALLLVTPTILIQFPPLRIDHHGWQILMAGAALCGALDGVRRRGGIVAGLAMATWLTISSEGLPYAALLGGTFALRQWIDGAERPRLTGYAVALGTASFLLVLVTRGWGAVSGQECDSLTSVYLLPLAGFAVVMPVADRLLGGTTASRRLVAAALGAGCAALIFLLSGQHCATNGPFAALSPLAYRYWYMGVLEGLPIWEQEIGMAGVILLPAIVGICGTALAWRATPHGDTRMRWLIIGLLLVGATMVSLLVMRAITVAHLYALPGTAWLLIALFRRAQMVRYSLGRVFASAALVLLTPAGLAASWLAVADTASTPSKVAGNICRSSATISALDRLPPSLLFAPLDLGPDILIRTPHSVIGTGHHRNLRGINAVVGAFLDTPDRSRAIVKAVGGGPDYLIICPGLNELAQYAKVRPDGLAAGLLKGQVPRWLTPVPMAGAIRVYRVVR